MLEVCLHSLILRGESSPNCGAFADESCGNSDAYTVFIDNDAIYSKWRVLLFFTMRGVLQK